MNVKSSRLDEHIIQISSVQSNPQLTTFFSQYQHSNIDSLPEAMIILDRQGIIVEWNSACADVSGVPSIEARGQHWSYILSTLIDQQTDNHTYFIKTLMNLLQTLNHINGCFVGVPEIGSLEILSRDNEHKHMEYILFPLPLSGEVVVGGIWRDITPRKQIEHELKVYQQHLEDIVDKRTAELQEANALLQMEINQRQAAEAELYAKNRQLEMIMNTTKNPIYLKDADGRYLQVNQAFLDFFMLSYDQVIGKKVDDISDLEHLPLHLEAEYRIRNFPGSYRTQSTMLHKDGVLRDIVLDRNALLNEDGSYGGMVGVITDITDKVAIERKLNLSHEWFDQCFNNPFYGICITRAATGELVELNNTAQNWFNYNRDEVIGNPIADYDIWEEYNNRADFVSEVITRGHVRNKQVNFRNKSGQLNPFFLSCNAFEYENELYLFSVINNITDYIRNAKDLARLDRLNIVGEMAASIGHEIRNPMTTVRGMLQMIKEDGQYPENDLFDLLIEEMDRANSILTEFLSLAPDKASSLQLTNLNKIFTNIYPLLNAEAISQEKHLLLQLTDIPDLQLDENEIRQLIINLVKNGLEASPPHSMVRINTFLLNDTVVFTVEDEGPGISTETLENIWKPFFTTKANGTGLGLSVCYSIVSRHHGNITVHTSPQGTTFEISFSANNL